MITKKHKLFIESLIKEEKKRQDSITINDIHHFVIKEIKTPYITKEAESYSAIILPFMPLDGIDSSLHFRILRLDNSSLSVELIRHCNIELLDHLPFGQRKTEWQVKGSKGNTYTILYKGDDVYVCTCPQYTFRRKECKHIKEIKEGL